MFARAARETVLAHVGTPSKGIAVAHSALHHFHEIVEREVVAGRPTPVVLHFDNERLVERLVRVGGKAHIVVGIKTEVVLT